MSTLRLAAQPLRRDVSRLAVPLLILPGLVFALTQVPMAAVLSPLLVGPWLWWRRERFWLDRCQVLVDGEALQVGYKERQLMALDLRYAARQFTPAGDLVLCEGDASYLALGVDPPEHAYPEARSDGDAAEPAPSTRSLGTQSEPDRTEPENPQLGSWRAVRLTRVDLARLCSHVATIPICPPPDPEDVSSLLQALGSVGVTGRRVEELLGRQAREEAGQVRPGGLLTILRERALDVGRSGDAARRILLHAAPAR